MHVKEVRQRVLRELVEREALGTQEEVAAALARAGFPAAQATVSRDIRDLNLVKVPTGDGGHRYHVAAGPAGPAPEVRLGRLLAEAYQSLTRANNLLVLKVLPGNAHAVGAVLDVMTVPGLLGTIAGDDTLLLVAQDEAAARALEARLRPGTP